MELPQLTVLNEQFAIRSVLGKLGPFEAVYLARDLEDDEKPVIIREFLPVSLIKRGRLGIEVEPKPGKEQSVFDYGYERMLKEASLLQKINHPNIVRQIKYFEENGTIYRVNEYHPGASLQYVISQQGGRVGVRTAIAIMVPLLEGLRVVHKCGVIHGSLSPEKIYLTKTGRPMLLSFKTTHLLLAQRLQQFKALQHPGFSPPEQYTARGKQGPWSDVYGCAATLYYILTGNVLPDIPARLIDDSVPGLIEKANELTPQIKAALQKGLQLNVSNRPQTIDRFRDLLVEGAEPPVQRSVEPFTAPREMRAVSQSDKAPLRPTSSPFRRPEKASYSASHDPVSSTPQATLELADFEITESAAVGNGVLPAARLDPDPAEFQLDTEIRRKSLFAPGSSLPEYDDTSDEVESWEPYTTRKANSKNNNRWMMLVGVVLVSVVTLAYLAYVRWTQLGAQEYDIDLRAYQLVLARGDSLFQLAQDVYTTGNSEKSKSYFNDARETYLLALSVRSDDEYVQKQINQIDQMLLAVPAVDLNEKEFLALISKGDSLQRSADAMMMQGDSVRARALYMDARNEYLRVLELRPDDSLASARFRQANQRIVTPAARNDPPLTASQSPLAPVQATNRQQMYVLFKAQGDSAFDSGNYEEARRKFQEALSFKPNDEHATLRLRQIDQRLAERVRAGQYRQHMIAGSELVAAGRPAEARREFELALEFQPNDSDALASISQVETILEEQARNEEQYMGHRTRGDLLLEQRSYVAALQSYNAALGIKPRDEYVLGKVREAEEAIRNIPAEQSPPIPEGMIDENGIYNFAEQPPVLVGGLEVLQSRLRYPAKALEARIEGRVTVRMIVDETGQMVDPVVIKGVGYGCDEEVLRVIRGARFEPGRVGGRPVKVWNTLYFEFKLDDI